MRFFFALFVALACAGEVVKVTTANKEVLDGPALVKFFAPWCGHCKSMAADWERLAQESSSFTVAEVDCTLPESKPLCEAHGIRGYPTILFFKDGFSYKYNRARKVADFTDFVTKSYYLQDGVEKTPLKK